MNSSSVTKVVNYKNASGAVHQLCYDDKDTLAKKYSAVKKAGVRAVGMWTADSAGDEAANAAALWSAVPSPHSDKALSNDGPGEGGQALTSARQMKHDDVAPGSAPPRHFVRRVRSHTEFSGKASRLLAAGQALNARDFGAVGDGRADDAPALQRAIDAAQLSRQKLAIPAGVYLVKSMLKVHYNNGPEAAQWSNCTFNSTDSVMIPGWCPAALHLVGDGGWGLETTIRAGALMDAVIDVGFGPKGPSVPRGGPSQGHEVK